MDLRNYIEIKYREFENRFTVNMEFAEFYKSITNDKLIEMLSTFQHMLNNLFERMNTRLPTVDKEGYFWAAESRDLIYIIKTIKEMKANFKNTAFAFEIDNYYYSLFNNCIAFLKPSGGSYIPIGVDKVELYFTKPIFITSNTIRIEEQGSSYYELHLIGEGSYAKVFKYKDKSYDNIIALKRAKTGLGNTAVERFKREFAVMKELHSPYILEVFVFSAEKMEYTMEYVPDTLQKFIEQNNNRLPNAKRVGLCRQLLEGMTYLHGKGLLHRDISPCNILIKHYEDVDVVKISDFGLVKTQTSILTNLQTDFKGSFNDPGLMLDGFKNYSMIHETYALTRILYYILTGRTNIENIQNPALAKFVEKGVNPDKSKRYKNVSELKDALKILEKGFLEEFKI